VRKNNLKKCIVFPALKRPKGARCWCQFCKRDDGYNSLTFVETDVSGEFKIICDRSGIQLGSIELIGGDASEE
jgi:hypothetical protein